ncbi:MAG: hypothetical protein U5L07_06190 [Desulfobacterales bacterium]|nr:hypothetical protein [Desulfobacterales bacterium]
MYRLVKTVIFFLIIALGGAQASYADVYLKQEQHTDAVTIMGQKQPATDVVSEIWITSEGIRTDTAAESTIMLLDEEKIILLDHTDNTYQVRPMGMDKMMEQSVKGQSPEEKAAMQGMMKNMMKMDVSVTATGESQTIRGWDCKKYRVTMDTMMGKSVNEIWATKDLNVDQELYDRLNTALMAAMPGMQKGLKKIQAEMKKIKGVQVKTLSTQQIMGKERTTTTELLDYKEAEAPAGHLEIPSGYSEKKQK